MALFLQFSFSKKYSLCSIIPIEETFLFIQNIHQKNFHLLKMYIYGLIPYGHTVLEKSHKAFIEN